MAGDCAREGYFHTLRAPRAKTRGIRNHGPKAAKPDSALPVPGSGVGIRPDQVERTQASPEDFRRDAGAREPDFVHQQQWKGRTHLALRNARGTDRKSTRLNSSHLGI